MTTCFTDRELYVLEHNYINYEEIEDDIRVIYLIVISDDYCINENLCRLCRDL